MSGSVEGRFMFAAGLREPITVPKGTLARLQEHVRWVEETLGLTVEKYLDNPAHWRSTDPGRDVSDTALCAVAMEHNQWMDRLWEDLGKWSEKPPTGETEMLTPADAATFWHGLQKIEVPVERWSRECHKERMKEAFEIMRGRGEGVSFGAKPLTPGQASSVIWVIEEILGISNQDCDMAAPREWRQTKGGAMRLTQLDELQPSGSHDGEGYVYCDQCGPVMPHDTFTRYMSCPRKKCPIREEEDE